MSSFRRALIPAMLALTLAACGGDNSSSSKEGGKIAAKSPQAILADVSSAIGKVRSYHFDGTQTDKDGETHLAGDVSASGAAKFQLDLSGGQAQVIVAAGQSYLKANQAFWTNQGGAGGARVAKLLADRWVKAPAGADGSFGQAVRTLMPRTLAYCLDKNVGTVTKKGTQDFEGKQVVVLIDQGERPGTSPGELYVPASGDPLPVRVVQTGAQKPGGTKDPRCDDGSPSTTTASDVRLSDFDKPVDVTPPKDALDLSTLSGPGSATPS